MFGAKMLSGALAPRAHEIIVQGASYGRTGKRNETSNPFFSDLGASFDGDALNYSGHETVDYFFFDQLTADVDAGCSGGGDLELGDFIVSV